MLEQLKMIYPNLTTLQKADDNYATFYLHGTLYGIPIDEINDDAHHLLQAILVEHPTEHQIWQHYFENDQLEQPTSPYAFRLIAFKQTINALSAIETVLNKTLIVLSEQKGIMICLERIDIQEDPLDFHDVIDVLSNDLDLKMMLFQSDVLYEIEEGPKLYQSIKHILITLFQDNQQTVLKQNDILVPFLTQSLSNADRHFFKQSILRESIHDEALLETVEAVIEQQVNVSSVAKAQYMHRNTVQKRIDKFNELTGLDIKQFNDALKAYICIKFL